MQCAVQHLARGPATVYLQIMTSTPAAINICGIYIRPHRPLFNAPTKGSSLAYTIVGVSEKEWEDYTATPAEDPDIDNEIENCEFDLERWWLQTYNQ